MKTWNWSIKVAASALVALAAACSGGTADTRSDAGGAGGGGGGGDAGSSSGDGGALSDGGGGGDGGAGDKRAFVTSAQFTGDLLSLGKAVDPTVTTGIAGADALCQAAANTRGLGGTWRAWISGNDGAKVVNAKDRFDTARAYLDLDGKKAWEGGRPTTTPLPGLVQDDKKLYGSGARVWTGTEETGEALANRCLEWSTPAKTERGNNGLAGTGAGGSWARNTTDGIACDGPAHLYCFEM